MYYYGEILEGAEIELTSRNDPLKRVRGWKEIGIQFEELRSRYPDAQLMGNGDRQMVTHLAYSARPIEVRTWNPEGRIRNQYDINNGMAAAEEGEYLYVTKNEPVGLNEAGLSYCRTHRTTLFQCLLKA